jgi:hypothetical protein
MNLIQLVLLFALVAVVVALFAWASAITKNANQSSVRRSRGMRRHWREFYLAPLLVERLFRWFGYTRVHRGGVQFANIGEGTSRHGAKSYTPDAATTSRYLCYKIGTDGDHVAITGAGDTPLGQSDDQADAGIPIGINLFGVVPGTLRVVTDGTISNGQHVKCGATGKVTVAATTDRSFGIAIIGTDQTSADGDVITIIHCVPHLYVF